jgi:DNA repair protein RadC
MPSPLRLGLVLRSGRTTVRPMPARRRYAIHTGRQVEAYMRADVERAHVEHLWVLPMDSAGRALYYHPIEVSLGDRGEVSLPTAEVLAAVLVSGAPSFVLVHNHPSGHAHPSAQDYVCTRDARRGADAVGLRCYDHVIVAPDAEFFSFREATRLLRPASSRRRP